MEFCLVLLVEVIDGRLQVPDARVEGQLLGLQIGGGLRLCVGLLGQSHPLPTQSLGLHLHRGREVLVALDDVRREPQTVGKVLERRRAQERPERLSPTRDVDGTHLCVQLRLDLGELRLQAADLRLRLPRGILRLRERRLGLLPLQGQGVQLGLLRRKLLSGRLQIVLGSGRRRASDEHAGEGDAQRSWRAGATRDVTCLRWSASRFGARAGP